MSKLKQVSIIGLGLLGSSIALAISRNNSGIKTVGYSHRPSTRRRARNLGIADEVVDDIQKCVSEADLVILATPICTFEDIFKIIVPSLKKGCIVTDVGSTKLLPHRWAKKVFSNSVYYAGSHPIAGSEQRGVEFARDDLLDGAICIITKDRTTNPSVVKTLEKFWSSLGCNVITMSPKQHDVIFGNVSHLPHAVAAALLNASDLKQLKFCGKGFMDTSRIASGPANVWADVFYTNAGNICRAIDRIVRELMKFKKAIKNKNEKEIEKLLELARNKRARLLKYKVSKKEIQ